MKFDRNQPHNLELSHTFRQSSPYRWRSIFTTDFSQKLDFFKLMPNIKPRKKQCFKNNTINYHIPEFHAIYTNTFYEKGDNFTVP
jgi:hypothetical protein